MSIENSNLQNEINSLTHELNESKKKESEIEMGYQKQLDTAIFERENLITSLKEELTEEKSRANEYLYKLNDCKEDLKKTEQISKEFNKEKLNDQLKNMQEEFEKEKRKLIDQLRQTEKLSQDKITERTESLKAVEFQLNEELKISDQKYRTAITEKRAIENQLKAFLETSQMKEERLKSQCDNLENALNVFLNEGNIEENHIKSLVTDLAKELLELQKSFDFRENEITETAKKLSEDRKNIELSIEKAYSEQQKLLAPQQFLNVYEAQKKELELCLKDLSEKNTELSELKEKEAAGFKGSRKSLSSTLDSFQSFIKKSRTDEQKIKADLKMLIDSVKNTDSTHTNEEETSATQVSGLNDELNKLRIEIRTRDAQNYEEKISNLEIALTKAQNELEGCKKILLAHIDTINALEDRIKQKSDTESFDKNDELVRLKMENLRLNSENAALLNGRQKMETHYTDQLQNLNTRFLKKSEDYDAILAKYTNLNESSANKKLEELRAWKKRSENMRKTLQVLEDKLADLTSKNTELLKFQESQKELYAEENKRLKEDLEKSDKLWSLKQESWEKQRKLLEDQLSVLREKSKMSEFAYTQMRDLLQEKVKLMQNSADHCSMVEKTYQTTIESLKRSTKLISDWISKEEEIMKKSGLNEKNELKKRLDELQNIVSGIKNEHTKEISAISSSYLSKIAVLKEKEENALLEIESLREQLGIYKTGLAKMQEIYDTDIKLKKEREELLRDMGEKPEPSEKYFQTEQKSAIMKEKSVKSAIKKEAVVSVRKKSGIQSAAKSTHGKK